MVKTMKYSYVVFCDLDETIINCKSLIEVYKAYCEELNILDNFETVINKLLIMKNTYTRNEINKWFYSNFKDINRITMQKVIHNWLQKSLNNSNFFNHKVINKLYQHKQENAHIIVVSGSFYDCTFSICKHIPVDIFLCIELEDKNGIYSGEILGEQTIGEGKAKVIKEYMRNNKLNYKNSYAYGDHVSDLPMLHLAENKVVVGNNKEIITVAKKHNWEII